MKNFVYDLETGGAEPDTYTPIVQCAIGVYDAAFERIEEPRTVDIAYGLSYAPPGAVAVNRVPPGIVAGQRFTPLEGARELATHGHLLSMARQGAGGGELYGYNNSQFDSRVLRTFLRANGQDGMSWGAREDERDVMQMLHAACFARSRMRFPVRPDGHFTFALEEVAKANHLRAGEIAHEGLADVAITAAVLRHLQQTDHAGWELALGAVSRHPREEYANADVVIPIQTANGRLACRPRVPVVTDRDVFAWSSDPRQLPRIRKFLDLNPAARKGMLGVTPRERPRGFQAKSSSGLPFRRLRANEAVVIGHEQLLSVERRQELADLQELLAQHDAVGALRAAACDGVYYPPDDPSDDLRNLRVRMTSDDRVRAAEVARRIIDGEPLDPAAEALGMSGAHDAHRGIFTMWRWEQAFARGQGAPDLFEFAAQGGPGAVAEATEFVGIILNRLAPAGGELPGQRWERELERLLERSPNAALNGRFALRAGARHSAELDQVVTDLHALQAHLSATPSVAPAP